MKKTTSSARQRGIESMKSVSKDFLYAKGDKKEEKATDPPLEKSFADTSFSAEKFAETIKATKSAIDRVAGKLFTRPYVFEAKNTSYDFIKKVRLNNMHQALQCGTRYDSRVKLEYMVGEKPLSDILAELNNQDSRIERIRVEAHHEYKKYESLQVSSPVSWIDDDNYRRVTMPLTPYCALNQFVSNIIDIPCNLALKSGWDFEFSLMPEATYRIYLFPKTA